MMTCACCVQRYRAIIREQILCKYGDKDNKYVKNVVIVRAGYGYMKMIQSTRIQITIVMLLLHFAEIFASLQCNSVFELFSFSFVYYSHHLLDALFQF